MSTATISDNLINGGAFIVKDASEMTTFLPEDFNEEQLMVKKMIDDFVQNEVIPVDEKLENHQHEYAVQLIQKAAELGLLGAHMPEKYGGMEMDTNTNTLISERLGNARGFSVAFAAHTGIGMLPILYFGTEAQKEKYLPDLMNGTLKASYCLTEPSSGSDALAAKTRADLSEDGKHYIINGQKMWITNAGFADIFIVFAQIDGDKFTGFIVEKNSEGLTLGEEEEKLGIKGSSTRQVFFENVKVPVENVLGEIGKGHHIAFNALNIGRFKLGVMTMGGGKTSTDVAVKYANERHQFNQPIANFGAIKYKLAEQAIRTFVTESATYRVSHLLQEKNKSLTSQGLSFAEAKLKAAEEYAIECSIIKIAGSETIDYVVDETVQVHGGMGFSEEGNVARAYRDARINRIYEGTNEINRLLIVDMLLKRAMKGRVDIVGPAWEVQKELASMPAPDMQTGPYAKEYKALKDFKKIILMVAGAAAKMQMDGQINLEEEQEVLANVANIIIDTFLAESTLLRIHKLSEKVDTPVEQEVYDAILKTFFSDAQARIQKQASDALASFAEGDLLRTFNMGLKRFTKYPLVNVKVTRRTIANKLIEENGYCI